MNGLPNALSLSRLPLAVVLAWLIVAGRWEGALLVFLVAVATDVIDGPLARRLQVVSPTGGLIDHGCDATFVTITLASLAYGGLLPWLLPVLVAAAFIQYTVDSRVWSGASLRASSLGRWNGIGYFVIAGCAIGVTLVGWSAAAVLVGWLGWALVMATVASMAMRLVAVVQHRRQGRGARG